MERPWSRIPTLWNQDVAGCTRTSSTCHHLFTTWHRSCCANHHRLFVSAAEEFAMSWVDWEARGLDEDDLRKLKGSEVYSADNQLIGKVDRVWNPMEDINETTLRVKSDEQDLWVPLSEVNDIKQHRIVLQTNKDQIQALGWSEPPGWVPSVDEHAENWLDWEGREWPHLGPLALPLADSGQARGPLKAWARGE
jgi:hypothetical protein